MYFCQLNFNVEFDLFLVIILDVMGAKVLFVNFVAGQNTLFLVAIGSIRF